jgi:hypothetical protein
VVVVEWMGLLIWVMVAGIALGIAAAGALAAPSLGLQSLLVIAGLGFCVLYVALDGPRWPAWISFGLALAGTAALALGAQRLLSDEPRSATVGQEAEELAAALAGVELPLLLTVAFAMALAAAGTTTVG